MEAHKNSLIIEIKYYMKIELKLSWLFKLYEKPNNEYFFLNFSIKFNLIIPLNNGETSINQ